MLVTQKAFHMGFLAACHPLTDTSELSSGLLCCTRSNYFPTEKHSMELSDCRHPRPCANIIPQLTCPDPPYITTLLLLTHVTVRTGSCNYRDWQVQNLQCGLAGWRCRKSYCCHSSPKAVCCRIPSCLEEIRLFVLVMPSTD